LGLTGGGYMAAFFCMLGHMFPVYYKFKGGKGVAVAAASMLMLNPSVFAIILVCFLVIVGGTKYVSLGSVMCAFLYPVFLKTMNDILFPYLYALGVTKIGPDVLFAVLIAVFVIFMHRENIKRLVAGTESKISLGKKPSQEENKNGKQ
ncbi:MAG: glycerol-3-phosphate acyltransferase, partial [Clostridia bacterium]|nr:glycerol-3-phosphate acyltransferase [Clostridia bacterium]